MLSVAIILAIALAIFLGYKTKINTGLFCIVFCLHHWMLCYGIKTEAGDWILAHQHDVCNSVGFPVL